MNSRTVVTKTMYRARNVFVFGYIVAAIVVAGTVAAASVESASAQVEDEKAEAILNLLPQDERQHVIIVRRNGTILAQYDNGTRTDSQLSVAEVLDTDSGLYRSSDHSFVATYTAPKPASPQLVASGESVLHNVGNQWNEQFATATGALHGVRSVNGWSAERTSVAIPCGAAKFQHESTMDTLTHEPKDADVETGYVYIGGWGAGSTGTAVDAGLQKSSAQNSADDYATYWKYGSATPITFPNALRYPCAHGSSELDEIKMELRPISDAILVFTTRSVDQRSPLPINTIVQMTVHSDGWWPDGGSADTGIVLKRMVTIAQPPKWHDKRSPSYRADGWKHPSYFGVNPPATEPVLKWGTCELGKVGAAGTAVYHTWGASDTWAPSGAILNNPLGAVIVRHQVDACDLAGIDLERTI